MRRFVVLLVVVVLLTAVALLWTRPEPVRGPGVGQATTVDVTLTTASAERARRPRSGAEASSSATEADVDDPGPLPLTAGRVIWPDGSPAIDAHVVLGDLDDSADVARTDEEGHFGFDVLPVYSALTAIARRDDTQWRAGADVDGAPTRTTLRLRPAPASETVHFVRLRGHDGGAIDGARVTVAAGEPWVRTRDGSLPRMRARGGEFVVVPEHWDLVTPLHLVVHSATGSNGEPLSYGAVLVELDPWDDGPTDVVLPAGRTITGRVLGSDGTPLAGADVYLAPPRLDGFDADHMAAFGLGAKTDAEGRYAFHGIGAGVSRVAVAPEQGVHAGTERVELADGDAPPDLVVRAEIEAWLRVTGPDGVPLVDARAFGVGGRRLTADDEGTLHLEHLAPGDDVFCGVTAPGHVTEWVRDWSPADGDVREVVLQPARSIRGSVLGPDGRPLLGVQVLVEVDASLLLARWNDDRFEFPGVPAETTVHLAVHIGYRDPLWTPALAGADDLTLTLPPVEGLVIYAEGATEVDVSVRSDGRELARRTWAGPLIGFDTDGWPERVDVLVGPDDDGRVALARDLPSVGFHRLDFSPGHSLRLALTVPDDLDARLADAWLVQPSGFEFPLDVRSTYRRTADGVPAGDYELHVRPPGGRPTVVQRVRVDGDRDLRLELE